MIMAEIFIIMALRIYFIGMAVFLLNSLSGLLFRPSRKELGKTAKSVLFIPIWPLAVFSPTGRAKLFKRIETL